MASSVAPAGAPSWARRSRAARKACGVWTATSVARSRVLGDTPGLVHGLDGVTRRDTGHGPVRSPVGHRRDDGGEEGRRGQRPRRVVHHDHLRVVGDGGQAAAHRVGPGGAAGDDGSAPWGSWSSAGRRAPRGPRRRNRAGTPPRPIAAPGGRPAGRTASAGRSAGRVPPATTIDHTCAIGAAGPVDQVSASFRRSSAVSSSTLSAKVNSDTRIWRARCSMRFSPADRPLSLSRMERFRTTSATW